MIITINLKIKIVIDYFSKIMSATTMNLFGILSAEQFLNKFNYESLKKSTKSDVSNLGLVP